MIRLIERGILHFPVSRRELTHAHLAGPHTEGNYHRSKSVSSFKTDPEWQKRWPHSSKPAATNEYAVYNCAAYLLSLKKQSRIEINRLHRLLYIAQGFAAAQPRELLFEDDIEAWLNGPVIPALHALHGSEPWITVHTLNDCSHLSLADAGFLQQVYNVHGEHSLAELDYMVQHSDAWLEARRTLRKGGSGIITKESLQRHFSDLIRRHRDGVT